MKIANLKHYMLSRCNEKKSKNFLEIKILIYYSAGFRFKTCNITLTRIKPTIIIPRINQEYSIMILII